MAIIIPSYLKNVTVRLRQRQLLNPEAKCKARCKIIRSNPPEHDTGQDHPNAAELMAADAAWHQHIIQLVAQFVLSLETVGPSC